MDLDEPETHMDGRGRQLERSIKVEARVMIGKGCVVFFSEADLS